MELPIRVEYHNYAMSKYACIDIEPGKLILIRGENNNGKSILFYGLEWLLMNDPLAKTLINNKALAENDNAECWVKITQGDYYIEIHRSMKSIVYDINGEKYTKVGKASIFDLEENVYVPGFTYVPGISNPLFNMHGEDRGLFPLDYNDQGIFTLFEKLLGLIDSKKVISQVQKEISDANAQLTVMQSGISDEETKVNKLNAVVDTIDLDKLIKLSASLKELTEQKNKYESLSVTAKIVTESIPAYIPSEIIAEGLAPTIQKLKALQQAKATVEQDEKIILASKECKECDSKNLQLCINVLKSLYQIKSTVQSDTSIINTLNLKLNELEQQASELQDTLKAYDTCPLCGHSMK